MRVSNDVWNPGGAWLARTIGNVELILLFTFFSFILVSNGQAGSVEQLVNCDPMCSSSCKLRGEGRCDRSCVLGWGLRIANWTCGQCESRCVTTCNIKGPGTCDSGCIAGYAVKDYNCVELETAITQVRVTIARPYTPIEIVRSTLRADREAPPAWSPTTTHTLTGNQNSECDPYCLVPPNARCAQRTCRTSCVPGYALVQWSQTNATCVPLTQDLLLGGTFGISTRWMDTEEAIHAKIMLT